MIQERLLAWVGGFFRRNLVTGLLFLILISNLGYSLEEAKWVDEEPLLISPFILGLVIGWLLARSRFGGLFALLYAVFISLAVSIQLVGDIVPPLSKLLTTPFFQLVDDMNVRVLNLSLRITGWVETLQAGQNLEDTGLFVLLLSFIFVLCGVWLVWATLRQRRALIGLLPVGLLLAINVHLSQQPLSGYMAFLACAVLLVSRTAFNKLHEEWARRGVDYPDQLGFEWGGVALALALVIVLTARLAPLFGTAEGWRILSDWVYRAREQTSDTASRLFSGVNPPPPPVDVVRPVYVNTPNLGEIGAPIAQGSQTVMWVKTSDPAPMPPDMSRVMPVTQTYIHYWRSGVYGTYTGRGWEPVQKLNQVEGQDELTEDPPEGRYFLAQEFVVEARHSGDLFSVNDPVKTSGRVALREIQGDGSRLLEGQASAYQVVSASTRVTANQLIAASVDYPAEIRATYLQLSDQLPGRVRALAQRLAEGENDPYHKAVRIQNYLRENYPYELKVPKPPVGQDVVDYFLFEAPGGFCSHYASAMAVMLRTVGVPARVATGYAMGDYDRERGAYRVPVSASHAWVEVYFPGYGWIEFEPTVGRSPIEYPEANVVKPGNAPQIAGPVQKEQSKPLPRAFLTTLVLVAALALLALPFLLLRMFAASRNAPAVQVDVLYRRMRKALAWAGLAAVPSVTPDEYLLLFRGRLAEYSQLSQALAQVTSLYRESVYSPHPLDERRVRIASQLWQQSVWEWLGLWLNAFWQRLRSKLTAE